MKRIFIALVFALFASQANAQNVGPLDSFSWEYPSADLTTYGVTHFRWCVDNACVDLTPPSSVIWTNPNYTPTAGNNVYIHLIGPQTAGAHTIRIQACNSPSPNGCGPALSMDFTFNIIPPAPQNGRFQSSTQESVQAPKVIQVKPKG